MTAGTNHEEVQEMLPAAALEILDAGELERVLTHIRDCPECAQLLQEYREAVAIIALELPVKPLASSRSAALRRRLMARVRSDSRTRGGARLISGMDRWIGWAVAAGIAGVLLVHHSVHRTVDYGWLVAGALTILLVAIGVYARAQQRRTSALRDRLAELERKTARGDSATKPSAPRPR
jgi:hypothetical protein